MSKFFTGIAKSHDVALNLIAVPNTWVRGWTFGKRLTIFWSKKEVNPRG